GAVAHLDPQQVAEADPPYRHAQDRDGHGELDVVGGPQGVGQDKGYRPQQQAAAAVDPDQQDGQLHGLPREGVDAHQRPHKQQDRPVEQAHGEIGPADQPPGVGRGLLVVPGADAAAHHRDHGQADGLPRDAAHAVQVVGHGVGRDLAGAEQRDNDDHD